MRGSILFICTGNYYRSRYAELVFNAWAEDSGLRCLAFSRGLRIDYEQKWNIGPMSQDALHALELRSIDLPHPLRMPQVLTEQDLNSAETIIAMHETEHRPMMVEQFPSWIDRTEFWLVQDVPPDEEYNPLVEIDHGIEDLMGRLDDLRSGVVV